MFFYFSCCQVLMSHLINVFKKFDSLFISNFLFFHSLNSSLLNLINNNFSALLSSLMFSIFSLLLFLKNFQSLNLHHQIKFLLFINPLLLQSFVLLKLFVSNCHNFWIQNHLVHLFHIIHFFIKFFLSFWKKGLILWILNFLMVRWLHFLGSLSIHLLHFYFSGFWFSKSCIFLFF